MTVHLNLPGVMTAAEQLFMMNTGSMKLKRPDLANTQRLVPEGYGVSLILDPIESKGIKNQYRLIGDYIKPFVFHH